MLVTHLTAARRSGAVLLAVLSAALLAGCTAPAAPVDGSASTPAASAAAVPAAAATSSPVSASGTGPGAVELTNPYFPIVEGRERMGMDVSFSCSGEGPFEVVLENSGSFTGSDTCLQRGDSTFVVEQSEESYRVTISVDAGVDWTFTGLLNPPHGP